jgi:hypothetical protein
MNNDRRFGEIIAGIFLLMLGASGMGDGSLWAILLLAGGIYLLARQFENNRRPEQVELPRRRSVDASPRTREADRPQESIYRHALESIAEAGLDPDETRVLPTDIGVMSFKDEDDPAIHRTRAVPDDIDYIQPFVQLRLPTRAVGRIRFEIIAADGETLFLREDEHQLERGRNLIMPAARLAIHDEQAMQGPWELRISADDMLLAVHRFDWQEPPEEVVRRHLRDDGEISSELRAAMAENRLEQISLDDLLADQEDETDEQPAAERRASRR